ncbi:MAG TPA: hypothetical protein PK926_07140 [Spirochaetota bacterium]|nr:hypothetical protein [Spirochaetota bacterium]HPI90404.1 hypothetical protein [Spirochaetota bacterium]HPR48513.1 hypothetical protein [Spirochaetota bacterium]
MKKNLLLLLSAFALLMVPGCDDSSDDDSSKVSPVESPYLICVNRNPGGVGFDFDSGIAYNLDENPDMDWDLRIMTHKGHKDANPRLGHKGRPVIDLAGTSSGGASGYRHGNSVDETAYGAFGLSDVVDSSFAFDPVDGYDISNVETITYDHSDGNGSETGYVYAGTFNSTDYDSDAESDNTLREVYNASFALANYGTNGGFEYWWSGGSFATPLYVIKTDQETVVKFWLEEFPASGSDVPTTSGYIRIRWEVLE